VHCSLRAATEELQQLQEQRALIEVQTSPASTSVEPSSNVNSSNSTATAGADAAATQHHDEQQQQPSLPAQAVLPAGAAATTVYSSTSARADHSAITKSLEQRKRRQRTSAHSSSSSSSKKAADISNDTAAIIQTHAAVPAQHVVAQRTAPTAVITVLSTEARSSQQQQQQQQQQQRPQQQQLQHELQPASYTRSIRNSATVDTADKRAAHTHTAGAESAAALDSSLNSRYCAVSSGLVDSVLQCIAANDEAGFLQLVRSADAESKRYILQLLDSCDDSCSSTASSSERDIAAAGRRSGQSGSKLDATVAVGRYDDGY
jgi:hypothetical protein